MHTDSPVQRQRLRLTLLPVLLAAAASGLVVPTAAWAAGSTTGSGTSATESRSVGEFRAIALRGSIDLEVRQGTPVAVQVQADDNLLPLLETVVESGSDGPVLQVRWKRGERIVARSRTRVSVTVPALSAVSGAGAGDIRIDSFKTPALRLSITGSGDAQLPALQTDELAVAIAGSGDVRGSGSARKLSLGISGSGDIRLGEMRAEEVSVKIAGSGDAEVQAQKTLDVRIAGSGDVVYRGDAALKTSVAGSGSVRRKE